MKLTSTKGEWIPNTTEFKVIAGGNKTIEIGVWHYKEDSEEATEIVTAIADLGNTAQKCNLLPSELLAQRDDLLKLFKEMTNYLEGMDSSNRVVLRIPLELSKKIGETVQKIQQ
jgi:hypothetical protein